MAQENDTVRPVWLTREQRDHLNAWVDDGIAGEIVTAWDAAPADALAAVIANRNVLYETGMDELKGDLRALGAPDA